MENVIFAGINREDWSGKGTEGHSGSALTSGVQGTCERSLSSRSLSFTICNGGQGSLAQRAVGRMR